MSSSISRGQFFFFGCWNYDNCEGLDNNRQRLDYRKGVIDMLSKRLQDYSFGIIAGDNAYARSDKIYYKKTIEYGFELLRGLKKPLMDSIGNHEIVHHDVLKFQRAQELLAIREDCTVSISPDNTVRVITINTNLIGHKITEHNVEKALKMLNDFEHLIKHPFSGWTIVVGHEPIITIKRKKKIEVRSVLYYNRLLESMSKCQKVVYMCADVHEFQVWNIYATNDTIIPMVVVGTGGAEPDIPLQAERDYEVDISGKVAKLVATQPAYGYCSVSVHEDKLEVKYHALKGCGYKPMDVQLQITASGEASVIHGKTKRSVPTPVKCQAPVIEESVCADKRVLYKPPPKLKQRPSSVAPPSASA